MYNVKNRGINQPVDNRIRGKCGLFIQLKTFQLQMDKSQKHHVAWKKKVV